FERAYLQEETRINAREDNLDGDTLVVDGATPPKRRRVSKCCKHLGEREKTAIRLLEEDLLDGDTLGVIDTESIAGSEVERNAGDSEIPEETSYTDTHTPLASDVSSRAGDEDDKMLLVPPHPRKASGCSTASHDTDDVYRPSPMAVDKNLTKGMIHPSVESELGEEKVARNQHSVKKIDRREAAFDFSAEKAQRWVDAIKLPKGHWAKAEEDLFHRLAMRGFEPLVPSNWELDFSTLPESLFGQPGDVTSPYIHAVGASEFRAINALSYLFDLGNQVRDRQLVQLHPEPVIRRAITRYIKWALYDSSLLNRPNSIPVHTIYSRKLSESTRDALQTLNRRLVTLANRYRAAWQITRRIETNFNEKDTISNDKDTRHCANQYATGPFPVLSGFLICGPIVALLTLNSDPKVHPVLDSKFSAKFISQFDFGEKAQDVWHSFAIAIAVVRMRKTMAELEAELKGGVMWMTGKKADSVDPDL
ncbi:hypothetical protein ACJ72_07231, partial [Emergomyces africanus]